MLVYILKKQGSFYSDLGDAPMQKVFTKYSCDRCDVAQVIEHATSETPLMKLYNASFTRRSDGEKNAIYLNLELCTSCADKLEKDLKELLWLK